jgi:CubicO group peptidase (beta-lactamase class C family)
MRERIFVPLGMTRTFDRDPKYVIKNRAAGYELENGSWTGRDYDLTDVFAAGAVVSTVDDLLKWDAAWRNDRLLKKESKAEAWKPFILSGGKPNFYGLGWNVADFRGHKLISHSGSTAGFNAQFSRFVQDDLSIIVLTNLGDAGYAGTIARGVAKIYLPDISLKAMKPQTEPDAKLTEMFAGVLRERMENRFNADLMSENLVRQLSTARAKANNARVASFGAVKNFALVGTENAGSARIYRYRAETSKRLFLWRFALDADGKLTEMTLEDEE